MKNGMYFKECTYIEKKIVRQIHDNLSHFSYSSSESNEEQINILGYFLKKYKFEAERAWYNYFTKQHFGMRRVVL